MAIISTQVFACDRDLRAQGVSGFESMVEALRASHALGLKVEIASVVTPLLITYTLTART